MPLRTAILDGTGDGIRNQAKELFSSVLYRNSVLMKEISHCAKEHTSRIGHWITYIPISYDRYLALYSLDTFVKRGITFLYKIRMYETVSGFETTNFSSSGIINPKKTIFA